MFDSRLGWTSFHMELYTLYFRPAMVRIRSNGVVMIIGWSDRLILHRHSLAIARFSRPPGTFAFTNLLLLTLAHTIPRFRALDAQRELARGVFHIRLDLENGSDANEVRMLWHREQTIVQGRAA
jgi:hypothetical protein